MAVFFCSKMQQMKNLNYEEFCEEIKEAERMEVKFDLTGTTRKEAQTDSPKLPTNLQLHRRATKH